MYDDPDAIPAWVDRIVAKMPEEVNTATHPMMVVEAYRWIKMAKKHGVGAFRQASEKDLLNLSLLVLENHIRNLPV